MSSLQIALVQMNCPKGNIRENLASIEGYMAESIARGADIVLFPEMSITGYIDPRRNPEAVLTLNSHAVKRFCEMTKDTSLMAIAGIVEDNPAGKPFITQVIAAEGALAGWYRKVNVADDELAMIESADETPIFSYRDIPFGVAICADVGHGDLFAGYAKQGAKIVFAAAAPGLYGPQETRDWQTGFSWWRDECRRNLSKFAKDGGVNIVVATQAGRTVDEDFPGGGYAFDLNGDVVAETADWTEGILFAQIVTSLSSPEPSSDVR